MTRKDFKIMAETMATIKDPAQRRECAEKIAQVCLRINPRFDFALFYRACGV